MQSYCELAMGSTILAKETPLRQNAHPIGVKLFGENLRNYN